MFLRTMPASSSLTFGFLGLALSPDGFWPCEENGRSEDTANNREHLAWAPCSEESSFCSFSRYFRVRGKIPVEPSSRERSHPLVIDSTLGILRGVTVDFWSYRANGHSRSERKCALNLASFLLVLVDCPRLSEGSVT